MGVAPPPAVPGGVRERLAVDIRTARAAGGRYPAGRTRFSVRQTRAFQRDPLSMLLACYEEYGHVFTIRLLHSPVVWALGPEANHYITVSNASNFRWRDGTMGDLIPLLGDGLLTIDGVHHKRARRIMLPAFHRERVAASADTMLEEIQDGLAGWRSGQRLDLYAWTRRLALRVAMRALFGFDPENSSRDAEMAHEFEHALGFYGRDYALQLVRGPGSPWQRMQRARTRLDGVIYAEIERRRATGERHDDVLSLLLDARDEDGTGLSAHELRDQVMTLLFAGHDTTTSTVSFLFYELARNPDELAAVRAELDDVLAGGRAPTAADLVSGLPRLEMAMDETLRIYPAAWLGPRRSIEPFELCGVQVPGGVLVNYSSWASHHLPDVFAEPDRFLPERFAPKAKAQLPKGAYVPFGGGSRMCIGMRFGQLEIKAIAASVLQRWDVELADPTKPASVRQMPTLSPRGGLPVVVRPRP